MQLCGRWSRRGKIHGTKSYMLQHGGKIMHRPCKDGWSHKAWMLGESS